jgi:hypothetical protein
MQKLNLPDFESKIIKVDGKNRIFDLIRKKYVVLTPEEWVRQHFIHYLINNLKYSKSLIRIESGLQLNALQKRSDIVVYDRNAHPWMIIECKAPEVKLDRNCFNQALIYNMTLGAKFITLTNGMLHFCFRRGIGGSDPEFLPALPPYEE